MRTISKPGFEPKSNTLISPIFDFGFAAASAHPAQFVYLNRQFQRELACFSFRPDIIVRPLNAVNVFELEAMVHSSEASEFDFIYGLHHRAVRDQEMLSNLQDILMQFPAYGRQRSARWMRVYEELQRSLFPYVFGEDSPPPAP